MKEDRKKIFEEYELPINQYIKRMFLEYDRYYEADNLLKHFGSVKGMRILDYGAGVGDYGMVFARDGARVDYLDFKINLDFIQFRMAREGFVDGDYLIVGVDEVDFKDYDFVVFGEVLEHIHHPKKIIEKCIKEKVKYLFTTAYPYMKDLSKFKKSGHFLSAMREQDECVKLLETNYKKVAWFKGALYLWELL